MNNKEIIIFGKNKTNIYLVVFIISIIPPVFMITFIIYHDFDTPSLIVGLIFSPVFIFLLRYGYKIHSMINNEIIISESGIIVEDYRENEFQWSEINSYSLQGFKTREPDNHCFLYLKTDNRADLKEHMLKMPDNYLEDGIIVCDLSKYLVKPDYFKEQINLRILDYKSITG